MVLAMYIKTTKCLLDTLLQPTEQVYTTCSWKWRHFPQYISQYYNRNKQQSIGLPTLPLSLSRCVSRDESRTQVASRMVSLLMIKLNKNEQNKKTEGGKAGRQRTVEQANITHTLSLTHW